ncbi:MAG: peptidoglycan endopeptidase [Chloroflexi bacterium]|nr:peptidoglycan endopeptidase [Chloroflexota bacterium]
MVSRCGFRLLASRSTPQQILIVFLMVLAMCFLTSNAALAANPNPQPIPLDEEKGTTSALPSANTAEPVKPEFASAPTVSEHRETEQPEASEPTSPGKAETPAEGAPENQDKPRQVEGFLYTIQAGDTLLALALQNGVDLSNILQANDLTQTSMLSIGQQVLLPGLRGPLAPKAPTKIDEARKKYIVQSGDILGGIAERFGTTVAELQSFNHLSNVNDLFIGQEITIPPPASLTHQDGATATPEASPPAAAQPAAAQPTAEAAKTAPAAPPPAAPAKAQDNADSRTKLLNLAMSLRGIPYRFGGTTPAGFDCSGYVRYLLGQFGVDVPHSAAGIYSLSQPISRDQLQPGDLVFFANTYMPGISHVGIYVGDGQFIHSPFEGRTVELESMARGYYASRYYGAAKAPIP